MLLSYSVKQTDAYCTLKVFIKCDKFLELDFLHYGP